MEEIQRESMDLDVLFVGAGPGNLAGALHLMNLIKAHNEAIEKGTKKGEPLPLDQMMITIIEKASEIGAHNFSGAVMDPSAIRELMPDFLEQGCPVEGQVEKDQVVYLTETMSFPFPINPPFMNEHGMYVVSLSKLCKWLGQKCEEAGVYMFPATPGVEVLFDEDNRVAGVRTGDKGIDPDGNPKDNFEPGNLLKAKVTVFGEGPRGNLAKELEARLGLQKGKNPQSYEMGVKEIFEVPEGRIKAGEVYYTMGYPLKNHTFGGGFIYGMAENKVAVGMVVDLHSPDPYLDAHRELQKMKAHPFVTKIIEGGKVVQYGGKALAAGGWHAMPKIAFDGGLMLGDSASMLDLQRLKGIHLSMKAGMLAAETIFEGMVKQDFSRQHLESYQKRVEGSYIKEQLYKVRNWHSLFHDGVLLGTIKGGLQFALGLFNKDKQANEDHFRTKELDVMYPERTPVTALAKGIKIDGSRFLDKLTDAYLSGTLHEEKQPSHLRLSDPNQCVTCWELYKSPCTIFCPVKVYEMPEDVDQQASSRKQTLPPASTAPRHASLAKKYVPKPGEHDRGAGDGHGGHVKTVPGQQWPNQLLHINFTNCIHCKTCDIKCPYLNLTWTPPEGGGGPRYSLT